MKTYELKTSAESSSDDDIVWAFDLGKGSIGEAVRRGAEFLHKASLLIPADFAETKTAAGRRRMFRTREAHKARERWLREVMQTAGIEILKGRQIGKMDDRGNVIPQSEWKKKKGKWVQLALGDPRLEREFPIADDDTCYTSCLLRIKLLRGEKLEPWQVFKAFHSAIQRRGYDPNIPWKTREARKTKESEDDDAGTEQRMHQFEWDLENMAPGKAEFHFPAYFDAFRMGLWNPAKPDELRLRSDCHAQTTRNQIVPRRLVEAEIRQMVDGAARYYPALAGKADFLLFGPTEERYASYYPEVRQKFPNLKLREGAASDWQGVVGQKIPRFENRIISKCALIPRLNVCKLREGEKGQPHEKSLIAVEVAFLMKLKNLRIQRPGGAGWLHAEEIRDILEDPTRKDWKITKSAWKKHCISIGAIPLPGHEEIESPRFSGRSRFCRPALEALKRLILAGQKPSECLRAEVARLNGNQDPLKGLVESDLKFLAEMAVRNDTWEGIYVPNQQLDALVELSSNASEAITRLIGQQNDPVVRHRLAAFYQRLGELERQTATRPDYVAIEFVREDFMGKKAKLEYNSFIKKRAEERKKAREEAAQVGATEKSAGLKLELLRAQDGCCLYTNEGLIPSRLDEYQIEHIVPRSQGGPDAVVNYVLTTQKANEAKAERTPYDWFHQEMPDKWDAYVSRVRARATDLRNKKVQLLISPNAAELAGRYTALAETAWIAKLAQAIVGLHFGWRNGVDENGKKRVTVISGGLTGRIRRKYALNQILNPEAKTEEEAEKKNRDDDRHHALDAMVISFFPSWARDAKKEKFFRFPEPIHKNAKGFFEKEIATVIPYKFCFEKAVLAETIYGARTDHGKMVIVQRTRLVSLAMKPTTPGKSVFDLKYAAKQVQSVRDSTMQARLSDFLMSGPDEAAWNAFCANLHIKRKDGSDGPRVEYINVNVGEPTEYKDMSKDGTGAFRRALKGHRGQIVYALYETGKEGRKKETITVRPIYAFESAAKVRDALRIQFGDALQVKGIFQSGCLVQTERETAHAKKPLPPGKYLLNTILTGSNAAKLTTSDGRTYPDIPLYSLASLFAAGMKRANL